jgi:hypothetical protein
VTFSVMVLVRLVCRELCVGLIGFRRNSLVTHVYLQ